MEAKVLNHSEMLLILAGRVGQIREYLRPTLEAKDIALGASHEAGVIRGWLITVETKLIRLAKALEKQGGDTHV